MELLERRTRTSKHFLNPNGTFTAELRTGSLHYQDAEGKWQDIDNTLSPTSVSGYAYQNAANRFTVLFGSAASGDVMEMRGAGKSLKLSAPQASAVLGAVTSNEVKYSGALGNAVDMTLIASY